MATPPAATPANNNFMNLALLSGLGRGGHGGYGHGGYYYGGHGGGLFSDPLALAAIGGGLGGGAATPGIFGGNFITDYALLEGIQHGGRGGHGYYGRGGLFGGHGGLGALALAGGLGGAGGAGLNDNFRDLVVLDSLGGHGYGRHSNLMPAMVLGGGLGNGIGSSQVGQMWAMNELGGGHSSDLHDILPLATVPGVNVNQLWGMQQMSSGHHNPLATMAAIGQPIPTDPTNLLLLGGMGGHHGYGRHGYSRRPAHGYGRHRAAHHAAPRAHHAAPRAAHAAAHAAPRAAHAAPRAAHAVPRAAHGAVRAHTGGHAGLANYAAPHAAAPHAAAAHAGAGHAGSIASGHGHNH